MFACDSEVWSASSFHWPWTYANEAWLNTLWQDCFSIASVSESPASFTSISRHAEKSALASSIAIIPNLFRVSRHSKIFRSWVYFAFWAWAETGYTYSFSLIGYCCSVLIVACWLAVFQPHCWFSGCFSDFSVDFVGITCGSGDFFLCSWLRLLLLRCLS